MEKVDVVIFGYGKFGNAIAKSLAEAEYTKIRVAVKDKAEFEAANLDGLNVLFFNLESDRTIQQLNINEDTQLICALDVNRENLYLALTLRELYRKNHIMSISDSSHVTDKLRLAGVNRVIDIYNISVNLLINILDKPVATKFLQGFINKSHDYSFAEITIGKNAAIIDQYIDMIDFKNYNIIFLGMVDKERGNQFYFGTIGISHRVTEGDILVFVGREEDIEEFKKACGDCK